jgi:hypothetical protein
MRTLLASENVLGLVILVLIGLVLYAGEGIAREEMDVCFGINQGDPGDGLAHGGSEGDPGDGMDLPMVSISGGPGYELSQSVAGDIGDPEKGIDAIQGDPRNDGLGSPNLIWRPWDSLVGCDLRTFLGYIWVP